MIINLEPEPERKFTHDEKFQILKAALESQEGIDAILEQTGSNFIEVINRYKDGDDTDLNMLMILMILASGRRPGDKETSRKKWKEYTSSYSGCQVVHVKCEL